MLADALFPARAYVAVTVGAEHLARYLLALVAGWHSLHPLSNQVCLLKLAASVASVVNTVVEEGILVLGFAFLLEDEVERRLANVWFIYCQNRG